MGVKDGELNTRRECVRSDETSTRVKIVKNVSCYYQVCMLTTKYDILLTQKEPQRLL